MRSCKNARDEALNRGRMLGTVKQEHGGPVHNHQPRAWTTARVARRHAQLSGAPSRGWACRRLRVRSTSQCSRILLDVVFWPCHMHMFPNEST